MTTFVDSLEHHYPTLVMQRQHESVDPLNQALFELICDLAQRYRETPDNASLGGQVSTQGGYQTSTRMNLFTVDHPAITRFTQELLTPAVNHYVSEVFAADSQQLSPWPVGWANLLEHGDWQGPHWHPTDKNIASGVYYVHLPKDMPSPEGHIEFINPVPQSVNHGFPATRRLSPKTGKLLMFPPWYTHYVHPFRGEGQRAIIAFDVLAQKPGLDLVF
ncbi:MAG: putative 2OG-Fe(II) oxygenase [Lysobacterales bacterium]